MAESMMSSMHTATRIWVCLPRLIRSPLPNAVAWFADNLLPSGTQADCGVCAALQSPSRPTCREQTAAFRLNPSLSCMLVLFTESGLINLFMLLFLKDGGLKLNSDASLASTETMTLLMWTSQSHGSGVQTIQPPLAPNSC